MKTNNATISEMTSNKVSQYKAFLAVGLLQDEEHFRITPDDDRHAPFPTTDCVDSFTLGAYVDGVLAGTVSFARDGRDRQKLRHKGLLFRMYVAREFRGLGMAQRLIEALLERVRNIEDIEQINLTVIADNVHAKRLYEKYGFTVFGTEERAIKWKGKYFTEDQMVLMLR
jgi:RimJ/RimL family protein N-acetyltransferase